MLNLLIFYKKTQIREDLLYLMWFSIFKISYKKKILAKVFKIFAKAKMNKMNKSSKMEMELINNI